MPILRYIHITKQFTPESYGVMDVNLEVEPGELVVITGHTGSGKTTLMKLLTREYAITEGELYFNDTPVHALKSNKVHLHRRQIGVVYQDYRLIKDLTVWENVALPLYIAGRKEVEIEQRTADLLNLIKLSDKAEQFPNQLSGGEAQRVSIARSLALAPELIFADEPTGNLDAETSKMIAHLFAKINELGTTVLLSTHDLTLLELFNNERHVQLEKGAIIKDSGRREVKKSEPTVATSMGVPIKISTDDSASTQSSEVKADSDNDTKSDDQSAAKTDSAAEPELIPEKRRSLWHKLSLIGKKRKHAETEHSRQNESKDNQDTETDSTEEKVVKHKQTEKKQHQSKKLHQTDKQQEKE